MKLVFILVEVSSKLTIMMTMTIIDNNNYKEQRTNDNNNGNRHGDSSVTTTAARTVAMMTDQNTHKLSTENTYSIKLPYIQGHDCSEGEQRFAVDMFLSSRLNDLNC